MSVRPTVAAMAGYAPGEQPRGGDVLKLNTNENPYPPSPRVFEAVRAALTGDDLRKYPDPTGRHFREVAAGVLGVDPDMILVGNGSDDVLTILTRTFVPEGGWITSGSPSYTLYRSLAELQGANFRTLSFNDHWDFYPSVLGLFARRPCNLFFLANPNSPSGTGVSPATFDNLLGLANLDEMTLVVDEAYADFADTNALDLVRRYPERVVVTRSLSKAYSLAGVRFGFAVADAALVREMNKVKDSYNCDVLSLAAAAAAVGDQEYFRSTRDRVVATRGRMERELAALGFEVTPSRANFVWTRRKDRPVKPIYEELKRRMILVRYMQYDGYGDGLRMSVGTDAEIDRLLAELRSIVG